jgi:alkyldihydroxyacetonephosphate synthase
VSFPTTGHALHAVRALAQDGLQPANCRLLDPVEAALAGAAPPEGTDTLLVLGFEAPEAPLEPTMARALELVRDHGGEVRDGPRFRRGDRTGTAEGGAGAWRAAFLQGPYLRDALARLGAVVETFETATTWDRAEELVTTLRDTATRAAQEVAGGALVAVRTTHAYPDGIAPYLTVIAPGPDPALAGPARGRAQAAAWDRIKVAVSEAIDAAGATITHHHAVGRDHRPWYDRQRPAPFAAALRAAKAELDPAGILNPGVLFDPSAPARPRGGGPSAASGGPLG